MRTSTIIAILFFVALAIVTVFLVLCQINSTQSFRNQFVSDIQNSYLNNIFDSNLVGRIYDSNPDIINGLYKMDNFSNDLNTFLNSDCLKTAFQTAQTSHVKNFLQKQILSCIQNKSTAIRKMSTQNRNGIVTLFNLMLISASQVIPGGGSVRED